MLPTYYFQNRAQSTLSVNWVQDKRILVPRLRNHWFGLNHCRQRVRKVVTVMYKKHLFLFPDLRLMCFYLRNPVVDSSCKQK